MIPVFFDRRWVHPWRRPAEESQSVRLSAPVRMVSPVPPYEPEPHPGEPVAPSYDFTPLNGCPDGFAGSGPAVPQRLDVLVFGEPGATELQGAGINPGRARQGSCPCGVEWWSGNAKCWYCEPPA